MVVSSIISSSTDRFMQAAVSGSKCNQNQPKTLSSMPSKEHNAAARSRIRAKSERRACRRRRQTPRSNQAQSHPEEMRHQCVSDMASGEVEQTRTRKRHCSILPPLLSPVLVSPKTQHLDDQYQQDVLSGCPKNSADKRKTQRIGALHLDLSPLQPYSIESFFEKFASLQVDGCSNRGCKKGKKLLDALLSPKTRFRDPTTPLISTEVAATTFTTSVPILRKKKDTARSPVSCVYYLWHMLIDSKGPVLFTSINGRRGSGWTIEIPRSRDAEIYRDSEAADCIYHPELHGQRKYNRESGFWSWR